MLMPMSVLAANSLSNAQSYKMSSNVSDTLSENNKLNVYSFSLNNSGTLTISMKAEFEYIYFTVYDSDGNDVFHHNEYWNTALEVGNCECILELTKGDYFLAVEGIHKGFYGGPYYGEYCFSMSYESAEETFDDKQNGSNNSIKEANNINLNERYNGHIARNDAKDIYSFTLPSSGTVNFNVTGIPEYLNFEIFDNSGNSVWQHCEQWNSTIKQLDYSANIELTGGDYYISFEGIHKGFYGGPYYGKFSFSISHESAEETFNDKQNGSNNSIREASNINLNERYNGHIARNDTKDIFSFALPTPCTVNFNVTGVPEYLNFEIFDNSGNSVWQHCEQRNSTIKQLDYSSDIDLTSGAYYISFEGIHKGFYGGPYYGKYSFSISNGKTITEPKPTSSPETMPSPAPTPVQTQPATPAPTESARSIETSGQNTKVDDVFSGISDWARDELQEALDKQLVPSSLIFTDLRKDINRREFAAVAVKLYEAVKGEASIYSSCPFTDVSEYDIDIKKAYSLEITTGMTESTFEPSTLISREQLATMLCRAIKRNKIINWNLKNDSAFPLDISNTRKFDDNSEISDYANESVYYMSKHGIIKGVDDTHFAPINTATREQAILLALRIYNAFDELLMEQ